MGVHDDREQRTGLLRKLDLVGPRGRFLRRRGIDVRLFGLYLHIIDQPDPGLDLHDHPWPFISVVLWGGYTEEVIDAREAPAIARIAEWNPDGCTRGVVRTWRRWSLHRIRMTEAHRITAVEPRTVTLVLRGRKTRQWGFYMPGGYVDQRSYDYRTRRPATEVRS